MAGLGDAFDAICKKLRPNSVTKQELITLLNAQVGDSALILRGKGSLRPELPPCSITDEDVEALCALLTRATSFSELDLGYNRIDDAGCVALQKFLEIGQSIKTLDLRMNDFGIPGAKKLAEGLNINSTLSTLVLKGCKIGDRGGIGLAEVLLTNKALVSLDVGDCDLGVGSLIAFRTVLMQNDTLKEMVLDRPLIQSAHEEVATHMAALIQHNRGLVRLSIRKHNILDFGACRIAEALGHNQTLKVLDMAANKIGRDGAEALAVTLLQNETLEDLNLDGNAIEDEGILALATAINEASVKSLRTLRVARNNIQGAVAHRTGNLEMSGLVGFARAMAANASITGFSVWGNPAVSSIGQLDYQACAELAALLDTRQFEADVKSYTVDGKILLAEQQVDDIGVSYDMPA